MIKTIRMLFVFVFCTSFIAPLAAQQKSPHPHKFEDFECSDCHTCSKPTTDDPCLIDCPRYELRAATGKKLQLQQSPDIIIMDKLENLYEPVKFSHRVHAQMTAMNEGCVVCHHHTPTDAVHPPCNECHTPEVSEENIELPGLKGAYHQQCLGCHREWSGEADCEKCHLPKGKEAKTAEEISRYKPCQEPDKKVYEADYANGPYVNFFHRNHAHMYGLSCSDCHKEDPCVSCHYQGKKPVSVVEANADQMHHKCSACHDIEAKTGCSKCHSKTEKKRFDHGQATGWALNKFHQNLSCNSCHPEGKKFARVDKTCNSCHSEWNSENFDHSIVGLALDEIHSEADCSDCHDDRQFDKAPSCNNCHEDFSYPDQMPGELTKN